MGVMGETMIKDIDEEINDVRIKLIELSAETLKQPIEILTLNDCPNFLLRDSIIYRLFSIRFHLYLIGNTQGNIVKSMEKRFPNDDIELFLIGRDRLLYLFDDIVFGLCSLLDYIGNMIGLIYIGQHKANIKWNGCIKSCRDKNNLLSNYSISKYLIEQDKLWASDLYCYRSRLIHDKKDNVGAKRVITLGNEGVSIRFNVEKPTMFLNIIKEYSKNNDIDDQNIIDIAFWLMKKNLSVIKYIIEIARTEIVEEKG